MNRDLRYSIRSGRDGSIYRAAIALPSRHGEIIFSAAVPVAAAEHMRAGLRQMLREEVGGGCGCVGGIADVYQLADTAQISGVWDTLGSLAGAGLAALPIPGAGLLSQALPAIANLFGGGPPPPRFDPNRPATLPPGGSPENLRRILAHVRVREGMPREEAARLLRAGRANRWNRTDFDDAEHLEQALEPGPVVISRVVARAIPAAPAPMPTARPQPAPRMDGPALPAQGAALAQLATGQFDPRAFAAMLAANASAMNASTALRAAPQMFGDAAPDFAALMRGILDAGDTVSGAEALQVPHLAARLARSEEAAMRDPRVAEYIRAGRGLHAWMHGQ
jgi:hypothetical protein